MIYKKATQMKLIHNLFEFKMGVLGRHLFERFYGKIEKFTLVSLFWIFFKTDNYPYQIIILNKVLVYVNRLIIKKFKFSIKKYSLIIIQIA